MARPGPQTHAKRQRELARKEKRKAKAEKMALRKAEKASAEEPEPAEEGTVTEDVSPGPTDRE